MSLQRLHHKSAIVTGSTGGFGLGIAHAFAEQGADVMLQGAGCVHQMERTCAEMHDRYGVRVVHADIGLGRPEQIQALAERTRACFGKIDIIVNNAGIGHLAPAADSRHDALAIEVLASAFHLIRAVMPEMKLRRWGRIINVAAAQCLDASPCHAAYVATRHGMIGLARAVALDGAEYGISARTICFDDELAPPPEELCALAVFFACDDAASKPCPTRH